MTKLNISTLQIFQQNVPLFLSFMIVVFMTPQSMPGFGDKSTNIALKSRCQNMLGFNMVSEGHPVPYRFSTFGANPVLAHISHIFVNLVVNINISIAWKRKAYFKLGSIILPLRLSLLLLFICCFCFCSCCCSSCCYLLKFSLNCVSNSWDTFVVVVVNDDDDVVCLVVGSGWC